MEFQNLSAPWVFKTLNSPNHAYSAIKDLGGEDVLGSFLLAHSFILSKAGASDKPGAIHSCK